MPRTVDPALTHARRPVTEYGCQLCDRHRRPHWHRKGIDPEFADHVTYQGRNSYRQRPPTTGEVFHRLMTESLP